MMSDYARAKREEQICEELKWLDMEAGYVQRTTDSTIRKPKEALPDKGQRDSNYLSKPRAQ